MVSQSAGAAAWAGSPGAAAVTSSTLVGEWADGFLSWAPLCQPMVATETDPQRPGDSCPQSTAQGKVGSVPSHSPALPVLPTGRAARQVTATAALSPISASRCASTRTL